jgi:hypothetical protein
MGHRIKRKVFLLKFEEGSDLDGATVRVRSVPFGSFLSMVGLAGSAGAAISESSTPEEVLSVIDPEDVASMGRLLSGFADALEFWDLEEEDGTPIPATREGVLGLDSDVALDLIRPWIMAIQGVRRDSPLPDASVSGATTAEVSLPMEPLSGSRAS